MKKLLITAAIATILIAPVFAEEQNMAPVNHYTAGENYLKSNQYTKAIQEYRIALRLNPDGYAERAGLVNSYLARAAYYNNISHQYKDSMNDLRSALFFIKYYSDKPLDEQMTNAANETEKNLATLMQSQNVSSSPKARFAMGKQLRATGNFAAAATEFYSATADKNLSKESYKALGDIANLFTLESMAIKYYSLALKADDKDVDLHLKIGKLLDANGQEQAAATHYNYALANCNDSVEILSSLEKIWLEKIVAMPQDAEAQANLGVIYQKQGNYPMALSQYQKAESLNPNNINTRMNIGTLYQIQKNYPMALNAYDTILQVEPQNALAHYYKAQCLKAMNDTQNSINEYKTALSINPDIGSAKSELFSIMKEKMAPDELLKYMQEEAKMNKNNPANMYQFAYELHNSNKLDDAILFYRETLKLDPKYEDAYINLAQVYKQLSQYNNAKLVFQEAKINIPDSAKIKKYDELLNNEIKQLAYEQASELFNSGNYAAAIEKFNTITPATPEALIGIAACYQKTAKYNEATTYYKKAFLLDSKNAEVAYYIAMLSYDAGNMIEAKTFVQKSIELDKTNTKAKDLLKTLVTDEIDNQIDKAIDLYDAGKNAEALAILNSVIQKDAKNANGYFYRALIYDAKNQYANAIADYNKAFLYNKDLVIAKYSAAVDYDNLKKYKEAYDTFKQFLAVSPVDNEYTQYAKSRINDLKKYATATQNTQTKTTTTSKSTTTKNVTKSATKK